MCGAHDPKTCAVRRVAIWQIGHEAVRERLSATAFAHGVQTRFDLGVRRCHSACRIAPPEVGAAQHHGVHIRIASVCKSSGVLKSKKIHFFINGAAHCKTAIGVGLDFVIGHVAAERHRDGSTGHFGQQSRAFFVLSFCDLQHRTRRVGELNGIDFFDRQQSIKVGLDVGRRVGQCDGTA